MTAYRAPRRGISLSSLLALAAALGGCSLGPVWARRIEGRVVDSNGDPVPGARVDTHYRVAIVGTHGNSLEVGARSTVTDSDGRFVFRGRPVLTLCPLCSTDFRPDLTVFHPGYGEDYGYFEDEEDEWGRTVRRKDWRQVDIRLDPDGAFLDDLVDAEERKAICHDHGYDRPDDPCQNAVRELYPGILAGKRD